MAVENVEEVVSTILENEVLIDYPEHFLVNLAYKGKANSGKLLVEVDGDNGLSIDHCGEISRKLGKLLEEKDPIKGKYILEVTSPGADKPLKMPRQYRKHIGRRLRVTLTDDSELEGKLLEMSADALTLEVKEKKESLEKQVAFEEIRKSNVILSFK